MRPIIQISNCMLNMDYFRFVLQQEYDLGIEKQRKINMGNHQVVGTNLK